MARTIDDARFWDGAARKYARFQIKDMAGYERTIERTRQLLGSTDTVLEIGCGTGTTALRLAPFVGQIDASDISSEMIAIALEKAAAQSCGNIEFRAGKADGGLDGDGVYDAALAFNVLHLIADLPTALAGIHRGLKPGGLFISKTPCLSEMNRLIRLAVPVMQWVGKAPFVSFLTAAELEAEIARAGFTIVDRERHGSERKDARIFFVARK